MNILVTGAYGQVGQEIQFLASQCSQHTFFFVGSQDLDITQFSDVNTLFETHPIDVCINCAAYTAVDKAEEEVPQARAVNADGVKNLAEACAAHNATLVHISTDYVFNGKSYRPLIETDSISPINMYGQTKWEGEEYARNLNPKTFIFRTSWVYSSFGKNFVKTMQKLGTDRDSLSLIFDQVGTPTYARDLAQAILTVTLDQQSEAYGTYHYSNEGVASWYDFALQIFAQSGITCDVSPILTSQYPTPAKRPHYSVLNKAKFKDAFDIGIPYWKESLSNCLVLL